MTAKRCVSLAVVALLLGVVGACSPEPSTQEMPTVNDENCKPENVAKITDRRTQEQFTSLCLRRGSFKPSSKKGW